jgi:hypothetical protein
MSLKGFSLRLVAWAVPLQLLFTTRHFDIATKVRQSRACCTQIEILRFSRGG